MRTIQQRIEAVLTAIVEDESTAVEDRLEASRQLVELRKQPIPRRKRKTPAVPGAQNLSVLGS